MGDGRWEMGDGRWMASEEGGGAQIVCCRKLRVVYRLAFLSFFLSFFLRIYGLVGIAKFIKI